MKKMTIAVATIGIASVSHAVTNQAINIDSTKIDKDIVDKVINSEAMDIEVSEAMADTIETLSNNLFVNGEKAIDVDLEAINLAFRSKIQKDNKDSSAVLDPKGQKSALGRKPCYSNCYHNCHGACHGSKFF